MEHSVFTRVSGNLGVKRRNYLYIFRNYKGKNVQLWV